jgi:hypothetical protein
MPDPPLPKGDGLGDVRAILAEELEHGLHPTDGRDLSVELDKARASMDRINGKRAAEAERLSQLVVEISNALVDLGMLPIQDIPKSQSRFGKSCRRLVSFWSACKKRWPSAPIHGIELGLGAALVASRCPSHCLSFFLFFCYSR